MGVPQVGVDAAGEQVADELEAAITVAQMRPGVDALAHAPTGGLVLAQVHGRAGGLELLGGIHGDERAGEQAQHMGEMAMTAALAQLVALGILVEVVLVVPFLDLTVGADLYGALEVVELFLPGCQHGGILAHDLAGLDGVMEQLPGERLLVGVALGARAVLGGIGRRSYVLAGLVLNEHLRVELRLLTQGRVDVVFELLDIAGVAPGVVGVLDDPRHGGRRPAPVEVPARAGPAERVVLGMGHKAVALGVTGFGLDASVDLGRHAAGLAQGVHIGNEGLGALSQIGGVRGPVVHLQVDVGVVVGVPGRLLLVVPHALQVARQLGVLARGTDGEVAAVLEQHGLELAALLGGRLTALVGGQQIVGGLGRHLAVHAQVERHAAHQGLDVGHMRCTQSVVALADGSRRGLLDALVQRLGRLAGTILGIVVLVVGGGRDHKGHAGGTTDLELVALGGDRTALGLCREDGIESELVVGKLAGVHDGAGFIAALRLDGAVLCRRECDVQIELLGARGSKVAHQHVIGMRHEELTRVGGTILGKTHAGDTSGEVEVAHIVLRGTAGIDAAIGELDVAPWQVVAVTVVAVVVL